MVIVKIALLVLALSWSLDTQFARCQDGPVDPNDPKLVNDLLYIRKVGAMVRREVFEELAADSTLRLYDNQWHLAKSRVALKLFTDPTVRNHWLHNIVVDQIENYGIKNISPILRLFNDNCSDTSFLREVRENYLRDSASYYDHEISSYKTVGPFKLDAHIFKPADWIAQDKRPAIVFFHGGSWYQGTPAWEFGICKRYAKLGVVTIAIEYRLYDRHGTTPIECITDAKSAIRWVRQNSEQLGVDPQRIAACGSSAGGHLALCAAMLDSLDESGEDRHISSVPDALVLYYSCFDPTIDNWFVKQVESRINPESCSPSHNVRPGLPPTLILHGTDDRNCPYQITEEFHQDMLAASNACELHQLVGAGHMFVFVPTYREEASKAMHEFLAKLNYVAPAVE